jgi:ABC-type sugar transport system substrate-binding protein
VKHKRVIAVCVAVGLFAVAAAALIARSTPPASALSVSSAADNPASNWLKTFSKAPLEIAVNAQGTANPFFVPAKGGTLDAGAQLGIKTVWGGTANVDTPAQIAQFKALVRQGYKGIVVIAADPTAWIKPINDAVAKGVVVVTANNDVPKSKRELFFGQDLYGGGVTQGQAIASFLHGKKGKVIMTNCAPGSDALTKRDGGARAALQKAGMKVIEVPTDPTDPAKLRSQIENAYRANPDIVAIAASCAPDTAEAGKLKQSVKGKFVVVGHDLLADTLTLINQGVVNETLGQNPYIQTWLAINYVYSRVFVGAPKLNLPGGNYFTGTEPVTKANVAAYIKREARWK